jgi:hypothetical protein
LLTACTIADNPRAVLSRRRGFMAVMHEVEIALHEDADLRVGRC